MLKWLYYGGTQSGSATIDIGTLGNVGYRMPRYNNQNTSSRSTNPSSGNNSIYSYGNYYTWAAAMASVIEYTGPTTQAEGKTSETANTSLCPAGWRLPYGRNTGNGATTKGFSYLDTTMGGSGAAASYSTTPTGQSRSEVWRSFPNNFIYAGNFLTASAGYRSTYGFYWSSTALNNNSPYSLSLNYTFLTPGTNTNAGYYGSSIRCVAGS